MMWDEAICLRATGREMRQMSPLSYLLTFSLLSLSSSSQTSVLAAHPVLKSSPHLSCYICFKPHCQIFVFVYISLPASVYPLPPAAL